MRVFERGDLARVMRASMSVPGAFAPVQIDGQLYVDGGLVRNLPVDVARATCADVVIAVNLGTPLGKRDQLKSVFAVALQSVNLMTELNVSQSLSSLKETDVLIIPELTGISSSDFARYAEAIQSGSKAARGETERLLALQLPEPDYAAWVAVRESRRAAPVPITEIRVATDTKRVNPDVIKTELSVQPGDAFTSQALDSDLKRLFGRGDFDQVDYSLVDEDGKRAVRHQRDGEILGTQLHQVRARPVHGLPGRPALQSAGELPQDLAQPASARNGAPTSRWASAIAS